MRHQPAWAFRQPQPHEEYDERQRSPDQERSAPAMIRREQSRIEQHDGGERAQRRTNPERAVDQEIGPAAHARRDQLLDGRVDGRVFAANAGAGDEAEDEKAREIPRERRGGGRSQVDRQRDEEEFLASEPVGEPAEEQCADHGTGQIRAAREPHIRVGKVQHRARLERARDRAGEGHLEAVEDPGDAERDDDQRVKAGPRQPVEPRRDVGLDDLTGLIGMMHAADNARAADSLPRPAPTPVQATETCSRSRRAAPRERPSVCSTMS